MNSNKNLPTSCDRSSSQISIYNYPDHLNPFHEEDNHKRLRFWKLSKRDDDSRRRSFSIGNLRDVWNFRSFTLKKKSSTLGIQKTSESPPVLRRNYDLNRSSSNSSLASTNPFETDIDSDDTYGGNVTDTNVRKSHRKKRKAPLPPVRNVSPTEVDIKSLTVEIERFVNQSNEISTNKTSALESSQEPVARNTGTVEISQRTGEDAKNITSKQKHVNIDTEKGNPKEEVTINIEYLPTCKQVDQNENENCNSQSTHNTFGKNSNIIYSQKHVNIDTKREISKEVIIPSTPNVKHLPNDEQPVVTEHSNQSTSNTFGKDPPNITPRQKHVNIDTKKNISKQEIIPVAPNVEHLPTPEQTDKKQPVNVHSNQIKIIEHNNPSTSNILGKDFNKITPRQSHVNINTKNEIPKEDVIPVIPNIKQLPNCEQLVVTEHSNQSTFKTFGKDSPNITPRQKHVNIDTKNDICKEEIITVVTNVEHLPTSDQTDKIQVVNLHNNLIKVTDNQSTSKTLENDSKNITFKQKHVNIDTKKVISKEEIIPIIANVEHLPTSEQPDKKLKVGNVHRNLITVTEDGNQSTSNIFGKDPSNIISKQKLLNVETKKQISKEDIVPNVDYLPTCEQLERKQQVVNMNTEHCDQSTYNTLAKESFYKNNNNIVQGSEYLNEPLTILENSEIHTENSEGKFKSAKPKSVKEIIDSINRSQKLLKESAAKGTHVYSTSLYLPNDITPIVDQNENSHEVCTNISNGNSSLDNPLPLQPSYFQKSRINKEVFQCRESSPTTSNLDWNPLPKPKRINSDSTN
ncbi:GH13858 [Drosophila grimshawi]|uniref:GH13858 n=1 Tax=Drosophila grimshawi TaxID=7222 RepID=B4JP32_DROGR|nr:GH13858 [Drosophila grimshawi]